MKKSATWIGLLIGATIVFAAIFSLLVLILVDEDKESWLQTIATLATILIASVPAYYAALNFRQAQRDSYRNTRPYINIMAVTGLAGLGTVDLLITNTGNSSAHNLSFKYKKESGGQLEEEHDSFSKQAHVAMDALSFLAPHSRTRIFWHRRSQDDWENNLQENENQEEKPSSGMPEIVELTVSYNDKNRTDNDSFDHTQTFIVDSRLPWHSPAPQEGSKRRIIGGNQGKWVEELANLNNAVRALNIHVGELRR